MSLPSIVRYATLCALLLPMLGCGHRRPESLSRVSLAVIVHDRDGYAWEGVEVRILEGWTEWSECVCPGRDPWAFDVTNRKGEVYFDAQTLAYADLGFREHPVGIAVLGSRHYHDEANLKLLVGHDKIGWVKVNVPFSYFQSEKEVYVEID